MLLVLCLCVSLCACGQSNTQLNETEPKVTQPKVTEPKKIVLNKDNIKDFLAVNISSYVSNRTRRAKVEIYPTQAGDFSNTKITLSLGKDLYCTGIKDIKGASYKVIDAEFGKYYQVEFTLPTDGRHEIDIGFEVLFDTDEPLTWHTFDKVSGTFNPR